MLRVETNATMTNRCSTNGCYNRHTKRIYMLLEQHATGITNGLADIRVTSSVPVLSGYHDRQRAVQTPEAPGVLIYGRFREEIAGSLT